MLFFIVPRDLRTPPPSPYFWNRLKIRGSSVVLNALWPNPADLPFTQYNLTLPKVKQINTKNNNPFIFIIFLKISGGFFDQLFLWGKPPKWSLYCSMTGVYRQANESIDKFTLKTCNYTLKLNSNISLYGVHSHIEHTHTHLLIVSVAQLLYNWWMSDRQYAQHFTVIYFKWIFGFELYNLKFESIDT